MKPLLHIDSKPRGGQWTHAVFVVEKVGMDNIFHFLLVKTNELKENCSEVITPGYCLSLFNMYEWKEYIT